MKEEEWSDEGAVPSDDADDEPSTSTRVSTGGTGATTSQSAAGPSQHTHRGPQLACTDGTKLDEVKGPWGQVCNMPLVGDYGATTGPARRVCRKTF